MSHPHLLHDAMDAAARRGADTPAFVLGRAGGDGDSDALSYAELVRHSDALARVLVAEGVQRGDRVGIFAPKSLRSAVAIYGIMKAGAAYVPIDPAASASRLAWLLDDCNITHLITDPSRVRTLSQLEPLEKLPACLIGLADTDLPGASTARCLSWGAIDATSAASSTAAALPMPCVLADDLAYIIYTSGSTGVPKGIMHTHRSGLAYARLSAQVYGVQPGDRLGNHSPLHFDISTFDVFTGPICGATTVIIPEVVTRLPASLSALIEHERLTIWYSVASALGQLLTRGVLEQRDCSALRWVLFGGDLLSPDQLRALARHLPGARFSNSYGPAEVNQCTYYHAPPTGYEGDRPLPIGRVWPNTEGLVLDEDDNVITSNAIGELVIRSATQMRGYWNRPDLNAKAFYYRSVHGHYEDRFYRTGDLVRLAEDGELEFHGRKDRQIKTRGYRVELDEVETALAAHPQVDEAAALPRPDPDIGFAIEAAVTWAPDCAEGIDEDAALASVRKHLRAALPAYAVPARVAAMDAFPRTPTNKIDRNALAEQLDAHTTATT